MRRRQLPRRHLRQRPQQREPQRQVGAQADAAGGQPGEVGEPALLAQQRVGAVVHALPGPRLAAVHAQLGSSGQRVGDVDAQLRAQLQLARRGRRAAPAQQRRQRDAGDDQQRRGRRRDRAAVKRHHGQREHAAGDADEQGHEQPQIDLVQGLDVGQQPRHQVGAAPALQPRRRQRLDAVIEPQPQMREQAERRLVRQQSLDVAPRGARDRGAADQRGRREIVDRDRGRAGQRHARDEFAGDREQRDVGQQRDQRDRRAGQHPAPPRREQREQPAQHAQVVAPGHGVPPALRAAPRGGHARLRSGRAPR
ncbi:hypothetical protein GALL_399180 [mine drainage metagenome]|uniref:Uncharacterized protein n=1 Tax=mine drainage metagenome TaxID=410659 RepID=A0A1J5QLI2_9ZZZZ